MGRGLRRHPGKLNCAVLCCVPVSADGTKIGDKQFRAVRDVLRLVKDVNFDTVSVMQETFAHKNATHEVFLLRTGEVAEVVPLGLTNSLQQSAPVLKKVSPDRLTDKAGYGPEGKAGYGPEGKAGYGPEGEAGYGPEGEAGYGPEDEDGYYTANEDGYETACLYFVFYGQKKSPVVAAITASSRSSR